MTTAADTRPRVLLVTEVDFWLGGAGHRARIRSLVASHEQRLRLAAAGQALVARHFDADRCHEPLLQALRAAAGTPATG